MLPPSPQYCPYCNRGFPSVNQYRYCDACGQPTSSVAAGLQAQTPWQPPVVAQGPGASGKPGLNSLVILAVGLALIVAIGLVIFFCPEWAKRGCDTRFGAFADQPTNKRTSCAYRWISCRNSRDTCESRLSRYRNSKSRVWNASVNNRGRTNDTLPR